MRPFSCLKGAAVSEEKTERTLTDADVDAIIDRTFERFKLNLGEGVWGLVWKAIVVACVVAAYYGWKKGGA